MTKILLVRHGHVAGIKPERFRGRAQLALTEQGRAQADAVAKCIASNWTPSKIYTSPMGRCVTTGNAIAQTCNIKAEICEDLNDIDYGNWQFQSHEEAREQDPRLFAAWFATPHLVRFPNGDSLQDVAARTSNALRLIIDRHADDVVVAVGHDSVNRVLLLQLLDQPLSSYWRLAQDPCCINEIDITLDRARVIRINEAGHLRQGDRRHE